MNSVLALKDRQKRTSPKPSEAALRSTGGLLRLAPCWVPRSFLQPANG
jgi:hypothetical protein